MKSKRINKKISLKKETIVNLEQEKMKALKGGVDIGTETGVTCQICDSKNSCDPDLYLCLWKLTCDCVSFHC